MAQVTIRPAHDTDHDAVRRVVREAFGDHGAVVADLVDALASSGHRRVELVATDVGDDTVIGHVLLSRSWLDARERLVEVLVMSPLAVLPSRQRAGTGTALVEAALRAGAGLGAPAVFLEGSPPFYSARGFTRGSALGFERPSVRIPDPAFQVHLLDAHEDWMRGRLVCAEPFWTLDCVGLRDPDLAELEKLLAG